MTTPELAPRTTIAGIASVWVFAAVATIAIGLFVEPHMQVSWGTVTMGFCLILAFVIQLWLGRSKGYIDRVALSAAGALLAMGLVSAVFALVRLIPDL
jgi:hypothetical protein